MYFSLNNDDILQLINPIPYGIYTPVRIVFIQNIRDSTGVAFAHVFNYSRVWQQTFNSIFVVCIRQLRITKFNDQKFDS